MDDAAKVEALRQQLPATTDEGYRYFNAGTNGPIARAVHEAIVRAADAELYRGRIYRRRQTSGRTQEGDRSFWQDSLDDAKRLRRLIARIFGAADDEIALMRSTGEGLNVVLSGLDWQPGDEIVTTDQEHNALYVPLALLAQRRGVVLRTVEITGAEDAIVDLLARALTKRTRMIALSHVMWCSGAVIPVGEIADLARQHGVFTLIDGAQSAGQIAIDLRGLGVDAYAISAQKWLCGPLGMGALYLRRDRWAAVRPTYVHDLRFDPAGLVLEGLGAERYELGESAPVQTAAFAAALSWLEQEVGLDWMVDRIERLGRRCAEGLSRISGVKVTTPRRPGWMAGVVCFRHDRVSPKAIADALCDLRFMIRYADQPPCPAVARVCTGWWNTEQEVDELVATVSDVVGTPLR